MSSNSMLRRFTATAIAHIFTPFNFLCNTQHQQQTENSVTLDFDIDHFQKANKKFQKLVNSTTNFAEPELTPTALEQKRAIDLLVLIGSCVAIAHVIFFAIFVAAILTTLPCAVYIISFAKAKPKQRKVRSVATGWRPQTNETLLDTLRPHGVEVELARLSEEAQIEHGQLEVLTNPLYDSQNFDSIRSVSQYFETTHHKSFVPIKSFRRRFSHSSDDSEDCENTSLTRSIETHV